MVHAVRLFSVIDKFCAHRAFDCFEGNGIDVPGIVRTRFDAGLTANADFGINKNKAVFTLVAGTGRASCYTGRSDALHTCSGEIILLQVIRIRSNRTDFPNLGPFNANRNRMLHLAGNLTGHTPYATLKVNQQAWL
jgi:hypothetical protein